MVSQQRRAVIVVIMQTAVLTALLLGGYYLWFLKPRLALPNALLTAEQQLAEYHTSLLQNRLALVEMTKLNPSSADFVSAKTDLLERLAKSNQEGLQSLGHQTILPAIAGAPTEANAFINTELPAALAHMHERHRTILIRQQKLVDDLTQLDAVLTNLFAYDPAADIGSLALDREREEIINRTKAASQGFSVIAEKLSRYPEAQKLLDDIGQTRSRFDMLTARLERGDISASIAMRDEIINEFPHLPQRAFETELALIRRPSSVELLTDQTNLLLEYAFWLERIRRYQVAI